MAGHVGAALLVAWRLLHVDLFLQLAVEKCCLDIKVLQLQVLERRHGKQRAQRGVLADRRKHLGVVHSLLLPEALGHQARLVPLDAAVSAALDLENPLDRDGVHARRHLLKLPRAVGVQGSHLVVHGSAPLLGLVRLQRRFNGGWVSAIRRHCCVCTRLLRARPIALWVARSEAGWLR